jgi:hypothetical protein
MPEGLAPSFLSKPSIKQEAKMATIQLNVAADPSPSLHWSKDGKELLNVDKIITRIDRQGNNKYTISLDIKVNKDALFALNRRVFLFVRIEFSVIG